MEILADYAAQTGNSVVDPLVHLWTSIVYFIPGLVAALIVIAVGSIVAWLVGYVVHNVLARCKLDIWMKKNNLHYSIGEASIASLLATLAKWFVFILFLVPAVDFLQLGALTMLLSTFAQWLPHLIIATIMIIFGLIVGDFAAEKIKHSKTKGLKTLGSIVRAIIIVFVSVIALGELGVKIQIAESTFLVLLMGASLAAALALGIGFGLGLKDEAAAMTKEWRKKYL